MPTLASLIHDCAVLCGAVAHEGTAASGTTTTLVDTIELGGYADDTFNDKHIYKWQGTGLGEERRITDHTGASGTLTTPTMTAPDATTKYIILDGTWRINQIRTALINVLRQRRRFLLEPKVDQTSLTLVAGTYEYTVPTGFAAIQSIVRESQPSSGVFNFPLGHDWWYINRAATRQIVFEEDADGLELFIVAGCKLRVIGQAYETEPDTDDDVISVQTGSVMLLGAVVALLSRVANDPANSRRHTAQASILLGEFQRTTYQDITPVWPNSRMVDE